MHYGLLYIYYIRDSKRFTKIFKSLLSGKNIVNTQAL